MPLSDGYTELPPGKLANVATCLQMLAAPQLRPEPATPGITIEPLGRADPERYRALLRRVGAPYLWQSPMLIPEEQLAQLLRDPAVEIAALRYSGGEGGVLQLDFRTAGECEIRYFGVLEELRGTGAGRKLMNYALRAAWARPIARLWLHTCTLDHPSALPFYLRTGFIAYARKIEVYDDPRLTGLLPRDCAPQVPLI